MSVPTTELTRLGLYNSGDMPHYGRGKRDCGAGRGGGHA